MSSTLQQRVCIKFCVKNGFNGAQTLEMLEKCFGNHTLTRSNVFRWHERFRSGRESVEDDERSGRPSTAKTYKNINKIKGWMTVSRKLTIRDIAEEFNIAYGSAQDILVNDLGLRRVAAKLVPKDLNFMQKKDRVDVPKDMLCKVDSDPSFIKRIITGDETWIYEYATHSRHQASEWRKHLAKCETNTIQQPPNSPDLTSCDFFLFVRLKKPLRGTRCSTRDEVMEKSKMTLMAIPQTDYKKCSQDWIKRWHKCVTVDGEYFEGDNIDYDE